MTRFDERQADVLRPVAIDSEYLLHPEGSVLIQVGNTKVICTATIEEKVPGFYVGKEKDGLQRNIQCFLGQQLSVHHASLLVARLMDEQWRFNA